MTKWDYDFGMKTTQTQWDAAQRCEPGQTGNVKLVQLFDQF